MITQLYNIEDIVQCNFSKIKIVGSFLKQRKSLSRGKEYLKTELFYNYECVDCGNTGVIEQSHLKSGRGCNSPIHKEVFKVTVGVNDITTTDKWMIDYLSNKNDAYKYSKGSNKKISIKCPNCGTEKVIVISAFNRNFSCSKCGDGISFGEKVFYNVLDQLNIDFDTQFLQDWSNGRIYDFVFRCNEINYLVEVDGSQHFIASGFSVSLDEQIQIDREKDKLALDNGYKLVRIDCKISDIKYIRESISNSELKKVLNLDCINWNNCLAYAVKSKVKEVCDLYNSGIKSTVEISKMIKISYNTVTDYLKLGANLNWTSYTTKDNNIRNAMSNAKKVYCMENDTEYESITDCIEKFKNHGIKLSRSCLADVCNGKVKSNKHKGYHFRFL